MPDSRSLREIADWIEVWVHDALDFFETYGTDLLTVQDFADAVTIGLVQSFRQTADGLEITNG